MKTQTVYFPNLNGLRFIAAFLVIIHHLEQIKSLFQLENDFDHNKVYGIIGQLGVVLFFVLSGYLITYLLLVEEKNIGKISIKDFYIRRFLRIWPLYYIIIFLAFFVLNKISFFDMPPYTESLNTNFTFYLILCILFLPNVLLFGFGNVVPYASQTWSIGVEEQFYIIWPFLMKYSKRKKHLLYIIIVSYLIIKFLFFPLLAKSIFWNSYWQIIANTWNLFLIDCMAIGGLFALWLYEKNKIIDILFNPILKWLTLLATCVLIFFVIYIPYIHCEFYAVLFAIIILNFSANPKPPINLENKVLNYLGKISYGLYMYHAIAIVIILKLLMIYDINIAYPIELLFVTILTIAFASLSYHLIEKRFIKLKTRFSKIISGDNARKEGL